VPSARNAARYAQIVKEKAAGRALMGSLDEALTIAREAVPLDERLDRITALLSGLQRTRVEKAPRHIAEIAAARTLYYEDLAEGNVTPGWPTHIPSLDEALVGGVRPGKVYVLAARPSVGKSSFSQQIGTTLARDGHPTLFLSQEMDGEELADRAVSHVGRIDYGGLMSGKMEREDWRRATEALDSLAQTPFFVDDQGALTLADIKAKARQIKGLRVLILDYVQLCAASAATAGSNRNAQVEEISRGLKALSKDMGLAVIVLSQLNRQVELRAGKKPILADLRDSGAVEQDADTVIFLWPVRQDGERRLTGCGIEKNRGGRCMEFGLDFYGAQQRWVESTESIKPEQPQQKQGGQWE
jgi:replicative DNA helicase